MAKKRSRVRRVVFENMTVCVRGNAIVFREHGRRTMREFCAVLSDCECVDALRAIKELFQKQVNNSRERVEFLVEAANEKVS